MISRNSIEDLRRRVNLHDVVAPYVQLRRVGSSYRGLSPFNPEKTPSFYVHPDRGFFKCFSSGHGGDLFKFIQLIENLDFQEAVEMIAERFQVPLEYENGGEPSQGRSLRHELFAIHEEAAVCYSESFWSESEAGEKIRNYWTQERSFDLSVAREFRIGLATPDGSAILDRLLKKSFSSEALEACGLFYVPRNGSGIRNARPRFRGRLMIPISDVQGRVIAFTARKLDMTPEDDPASEAKYINSPDTPLFQKGEVLFGLDRARLHIASDKVFLMVEGQLDAIRCHSCGIGSTIAPQGTGVTEKQLERLKRYADRLDLMLDGDSAGRQAALRILPLALRAGLEPRVIPLEPGIDPDSLLAIGQTEALASLRENGLSAVEFAAQSFLPRPPEECSPLEKDRALNLIFEILSGVESEVARDEYLLQASRALRSDAGAVMRDFERFRRQRLPFRPAEPPDSPAGNQDSSPVGGNARLTNVEKDLLWILLYNEQLGKTVAHLIDSEWINLLTPAGTLLQKVLADFEHDAWQGLDQIDRLLESQSETELVSELLFRELSVSGQELLGLLNSCLQCIYERYVQREIRLISQQMSNLTSDPDASLELLRRQSELRRMRRNAPSVTLAETMPQPA